MYTGKQVFVSDQVYTWRMPSLYCLGNGVAGCGSAYFHFYRNGRVMYYSKDVWGIAEFTGAPIGNATYAWSRYYIEGDLIVLSDTSKIPLLKGFRKLQFGQFFYTNLESTSGKVAPPYIASSVVL